MSDRSPWDPTEPKVEEEARAQAVRTLRDPQATPRAKAMARAFVRSRGIEVVENDLPVMSP